MIILFVSDCEGFEEYLYCVDLINCMNGLQTANTVPNAMNYGWKQDDGRFVSIWYEVKVSPTPKEVEALKKTMNKNLKIQNDNEESIYFDSAASDFDGDWSVDAKEDGGFY